MSQPQIPALIALAHQFRLGQSLHACQLLPALLDMILAETGSLPTELVAALLQCQQRQDWLGLADYLEYDLVERLGPPPSEQG